MTSSPPGAAPRRIGLFGGTFDPVHLAHLALAHSALESLRLDEVRWIPAGDPWQKQRTITLGVHREAMLRLALAGEPRFVVERAELERAGPSYTLDTVHALQSATPGAQWYLILGEDQYTGLHTWNRWQELLQCVVLAVARRPGGGPEAHPQVRAAQQCAVPLPPMAISSTEIRRRAAAGEGIAELVPAAVARYIARHSLYRKGAAP